MSFDKKLSRREFLENSVHIGHPRASLNAFMKENMVKVRKNISLINVSKSSDSLHNACSFLYEATIKNPQIEILFLFLKHRTSDVLLSLPQIENGEHTHFFTAWPNGFLTNFENVFKNIQKLNDLKTSDALKDSLTLRYMKKLNASYGGVTNLKKLPDVVIGCDIKYCGNALMECRKLGIKTIAIADSDANPKKVDFPIFGNDDAKSSVFFLLSLLVDSYLFSLAEVK